MPATSLRRTFLAASLILTVGLLVGCESNGTSSTATNAPSANYQFQVALAKICTDKLGEVKALGGVRITKAGIEKVGLPVVKEKLGVLLGKLVAIQERYTRKRESLNVPPALQKLFAETATGNARSTEALNTFKDALPKISTTEELVTQTKRWLADSAKEAKIGNRVAEEIGVPECVNKEANRY